MRRCGAVLLGVLLSVGPWSTQADAQIAGVLGQAIQTQAGLNAAALQHPFAAFAGYRFGTGVGGNFGALQGMNRGLGYGAMMNNGFGYLGGGGGYGYLGGGSLANNIAGAYIGLGYGALGAYYSGMNTAGLYSGLSGGYQGYLTGAASITNANANYWLTISQARLTRQEALRSAIQTRRAMIEQAEYERAHMPDPEKIRQDQLRRELDRARVSPPMTEVWSGNSLNVLLRNLITQQGQGVRGPNVSLSEDTLKSINLTAGDTRGNVGLLKEQGNLQWPQPLQSAPFKEAREDLTRRLKQAVDTVSVGNKTPDPSTLSDLTADLKRLEETLDANVSELSPDQFTEARRYLRLVNNAVTALKSPDVANWFNGSRTAKSKNVAELVKFMADKGLWFAPAAPSDEPAYLALYHALAAYDAATARAAGSGGGGGDSK
jgi:hypothetical protein